MIGDNLLINSSHAKHIQANPFSECAVKQLFYSVFIFFLNVITFERLWPKYIFHRGGFDVNHLHASGKSTAHLTVAVHLKKKSSWEKNICRKSTFLSWSGVRQFRTSRLFNKIILNSSHVAFPGLHQPADARLSVSQTCRSLWKRWVISAGPKHTIISATLGPSWRSENSWSGKKQSSPTRRKSFGESLTIFPRFWSCFFFLA